MQRKISISIPPDLLAAVDQAAHTEHRPRSAMIALILRDALKRPSPAHRGIKCSLCGGNHPEGKCPKAGKGK